MEKIVVHVQDREKARMLLELLAALDFVESVAAGHAEAESAPPPEPLDFFAAAGIWQGRDITAESLRKLAWPERRA